MIRDLKSLFILCALMSAPFGFGGMFWNSGDCSNTGGRFAVVSGTSEGAGLCSRAISRAQTEFDIGMAKLVSECSREGGTLTPYRPQSHTPELPKCDGSLASYDHHTEQTLICNCSDDAQAANEGCSAWGIEVVTNAYTGASSNGETLSDVCLPDFSGADPNKKNECNDHWSNLWGRTDGKYVPTQLRCVRYCQSWMDKFCRDVPKVRDCVTRWFDPNRSRDSATLWAFVRLPGMDDYAFSLCEQQIRSKCSEGNWLPEKWLQFCNDPKLFLPIPAAVKAYIKQQADAQLSPKVTPATTLPNPINPIADPLTTIPPAVD